jgi:hypothetical protein
MQTKTVYLWMVKITQGLFFLNVLFWLVFAVANADWWIFTNSEPNHVEVGVIMALLMLGNAIAMLIGGLGLGTRSKLLYLFAVLVIAVNIILTFPDQLGVYDFITVALDIIILGLLIVIRGRYFVNQLSGSSDLSGS